jgi:hypothetical protein
MPTPPDPAVLYPDVAAAGSLAAALRAAAEGCLGTAPVMSSGSDPLFHATVASGLAHRQPLEVRAWVHERRWSIRGTGPFENLALVDGRTDDLAAVARVANAWHDGADLDDIALAASFVHLTGRFEIPHLDPARLTASEWQAMRREAAEMDYTWQETYQALIEAAHAEPTLRALYPFTSHWTLRFSVTTQPGLTVVGPCLSAQSDGTYAVGTTMAADQDLGRFATPHEAVAVAAHHLPSGLGPVTLGT